MRLAHGKVQHSANASNRMRSILWYDSNIGLTFQSYARKAVGLPVSGRAGSPTRQRGIVSRAHAERGAARLAPLNETGEIRIGASGGTMSVPNLTLPPAWDRETEFRGWGSQTGVWEPGRGEGRMDL